MSSDYLIRRLRPQYRASLLDMVSTAFSEHDPLAKSQGVSAADFRGLIAEMLDDFQDLSWLAIDATGWDALPEALARRLARSALERCGAGRLVMRRKYHYFALSQER